MSTRNFNDLYTVQITKFAESHFLKKFKKKHKKQWDITFFALEKMLERIDSLIKQTNRAEIITTNDQHKLVKVYFSIAGTKISAKSSGNRMIIWINEEAKICSILLAYSKNDIPTQNETQTWKKIVKENHPELKAIFRL